MVFHRYAAGPDGTIVKSNYNSDGEWVGEGPDPRIEFPVTNLFSTNGPPNHDTRIRRRNPARRFRPSYKIKKAG